jgi:hypothetical protein
MTELGNLLRDLATLNGAIAPNRMHLHQRSSEEIQLILDNTAWCMTELENLKADLKRRQKPC